MDWLSKGNLRPNFTVKANTFGVLQGRSQVEGRHPKGDKRVWKKDMVFLEERRCGGGAGNVTIGKGVLRIQEDTSYSVVIIELHRGQGR